MTMGSSSPKRESYQGYSAHITDDQALTAFVAKFGRLADVLAYEARRAEWSQ